MSRYLSLSGVGGAGWPKEPTPQWLNELTLSPSSGPPRQLQIVTSARLTSGLPERKLLSVALSAERKILVAKVAGEHGTGDANDMGCEFAVVGPAQQRQDMIV